MAQKYNLIQSVCRAFTILEQFSHNERELGVTAIAARVGLHKSTCFGLLNTLQELGYIKQNAETGRYSLGLKTFELGQAYIEGQDLRLLAAPFLRTLVEKTQETVHLVALEGERAVYIDKVEGAHAITISSHIGQQAKLHCTGVGKVLLANMPLQEQDNILSRELDQVTDKTITAQTKLREHLREIKYHGYGIDDEEIEIGLRCVAAPIFNAQGKAFAAVSISGPSTRITPDKFAEFGSLVCETGREISRQLGNSSFRSFPTSA